MIALLVPWGCSPAKTTTPTDGSTTVPVDPTSDSAIDTPTGSESATSGVTGATGSTGGTATTGDTGGLGPVIGTGACGGYPASAAAVPYPTSPELNLIGVYQSAAGTIDVDIQRQAEMVLVLSSFDAVTWNLTVDPGATVTTVILNGYSPQTVTGFTGTIDDRSPYANWLGAYAYAWPSATGGSDTPALVSAVESVSGLTLTSFTGCYEASGFRLQ